ncbi:MAG: NAD-dependent succinate-semialdehyde dehydrogenase [Rhodobacteraceae bacterium]|jgi:succinate-semialdehyde dehydrogenase/glutarate-semialdehyde dehydrogenase|uniref:Succinate semialdehyde dehydrogenase n=1 Tax=Salipiger profundus TaxID=1229727 RepID=A0A1U7D5J5_9RHOB|nr:MULTISPECIES: NAD-dependent succinate-semialdehyde dehydrogenase [Salipiger]APX23421.1 succinate semialdehyde dehydrogenase [Salipiger profundus]MAB06695.1 NAD-dependent succinate-semialdehyde dehydrogenase [Paracoccaceae bacterium]GGA28950.1 NAD-dependent succinate-semialdehyde dehydrogenase [Salipiger profundus]SFD89762.1 succinate semialdehyde dehydrogenase [Salipiger profundus]
MNLKDNDLFRQAALIGGEWIARDDMAVIDPATGAAMGHMPDCTAEETHAAIAAAEAAMVEWKARTHLERADLLMKWYDLMVAHADDLALILTTEQGKPLAEAKGEILYGASFVRWFAEEARRINGHIIPSPVPGKKIFAMKEPVGVCAIITPWNFPNAMITRKVAPGLAAGCTMVIKPSDFTPYSALALCVLAERAGIPAGVLNCVTGRPEAIGGALTSSPVVRKLSFTGSTRVGALLAEQCAPTLKKMSLELGGNAPFIVFDDADLDAAVEGAMASKFRNGGQTCVCANRLLVQSGIHDAFVAKLAEKVDALKVGAGTEDGTTIGPMINAAAITKINAHVEDALSKGAARATTPRDLAPQFADPVVLINATTDMQLAGEETFGPVAPVFRFETEEEALTIANGTPFGLAAYFFTTDMARAFRFGEALEVGLVGLNTGAVSHAEAPFGGVKASGLGREGSQEGIEEYLDTKAFHFGGL